MGVPFLHSGVLTALGIEHGLGTRSSAHAQIPALVRVKQEHGNRILEASGVSADSRADALWTATPAVAVGIVTADCVPLLLADRERRVVAAVHAGWRGSAARIAEQSVHALGGALGIDADRLVAVIGPHIGPCCYEVDEPVRRAIEVEEVFTPGSRPGHYQLDLFALNRLQLLRAGLHCGQIERVGGCTACDRVSYASYRRDGSGARMLHFIRMPVS